MLAELTSITAPAETYRLYADLFFAYMAVESHPLALPVLSPNSLSQNFAPALIMLRVVLERARSDTEWSGKISGLQFNSTPGVRESTTLRGVASTISTVPRSYNGRTVDLEVNRESLNAEKVISEADELKGSWRLGQWPVGYAQ
jgi:hypothetical protein